MMQARQKRFLSYSAAASWESGAHREERDPYTTFHEGGL